MTAKEFLEQYKDAIRAVDDLQAEYNKQQEQIDQIRSALGGDGLPKSSAVRKEVEEKAINLAEMAEKVLLAQAEALAVRQHVERVVRKIPGAPGDVIRKHYIDLMKFEDVAEALGYSERQCYNLRDKGLDIIDELAKTFH